MCTQTRIRIRIINPIKTGIILHPGQGINKAIVLKLENYRIVDTILLEGRLPKRKLETARVNACIRLKKEEQENSL